MSLNIQLNIIQYHETRDIMKNLNSILKRNQLNLYNIKSKLRFNRAVLHDINCFRFKVETYEIYTYQDTIFENL